MFVSVVVEEVVVVFASIVEEDVRVVSDVDVFVSLWSVVEAVLVSSPSLGIDKK